MRRAIICDIDQCLLDSLQPIMLKERGLATGLPEKEAWDLFYNNLHLCKRNEWCFELLEQFTKHNNVTVLFITGREERARKHTEAYFNFKHKFEYKMYMRKNGCLEPDAKVKHEILQDLVNEYEILFAIDDREPNCQVYRSFGITTLKVDSLETH